MILTALPWPCARLLCLLLLCLLLLLLLVMLRWGNVVIPKGQLA